MAHMNSSSPRDSQLKLIIGIDFGTCNSGAAYAIIRTQDHSEPEVVVIRRWSPGIRGDSFRQASDKVPTEIAYDVQGNPHCGWDIPDGLEKIQWVKLLLEDQAANPYPGEAEQMQNAQATLKRLKKTATEATSDYLAWMWGHIETHIISDEDDKQIFKNAATTIVMTVPAVWSDKAKDNTVKAAEKAGFTKHGQQLKFISEPEAAAIFGCKQRVRAGKIRKEDCVIVCDAGGGTVDVVSYQVKSADPLVLDQCVIADGDLCGSVFVDLQFENQLQGILQGDWDRLTQQSKAKIAETFEYAIKRSYGPETAKQAYFLDVPGLPDDPDPERNIRRGKFKIPNSILSVSFEHIITQIMILIEGQKDGLQKKKLSSKLKGILLVGGFGGSNFLHQRIRQEFPEDEGVKIWQADTSWTSVVKGAVLCECLGLGKITPVNTRLSRCNFGVVYNTIFDPMQHNPSDRWECPITKLTKARNQIQWLVKKGQEINPSTQLPPYQFALVVKDEDQIGIDSYSMSFSIVRNDLSTAPSRKTSDVYDFADIECHLPKAFLTTPYMEDPKTKARMWRIPIMLEIVMGPTIVGFRCMADGKVVGMAEVSYRDIEKRSVREGGAEWKGIEG